MDMLGRPTLTTSASASSRASARRGRSRLSAAVALAVACGAGQVNGVDDTGLDGLTLHAVNPGTVLPGSKLVVSGDSFVGSDYGASVLHLSGAFGGAQVDLRVPLVFADYQTLTAAWKGGKLAGFPADDGSFDGQAAVEVTSTVDHAVHASPALRLRLTVAHDLAPTLQPLTGGIIYVNQSIAVSGAGLLLGGDEGQTVAVVNGCFQASAGATCDPVNPVEIPVTPASAYARDQGSFPFAPRIAGIQPGSFQGTVHLANLRGGARSESASTPANVTLITPAIFSVSPAAASLGQYVDLRGGGFVGPESPDDTTSYTMIELEGKFTPEGQSQSGPVSLSVLPLSAAGALARYVINEDDALGRAIDLRKSAGTFDGTVRPVVHYQDQTVRGAATAVTLGVAHVKQVVWIRFQPGYVESLRAFGLRATDKLIRDRVFTVARRDYKGVNIEFRDSEPDDFAQYETVDIEGPDLNGLGLFGYDSSPGKDVGNKRLYDQVGGFYALTQENGDAGYGGVFVKSFFGFSMHPNDLAKQIPMGSSPAFDAIFDPFRPDVGGAPALAADLSGIRTRSDGAGCPAAGGDRPAQISCAVFVLGSMIGTTMTHEIGHSLGLAAPDKPAEPYHDPGDRPNRLMDAGGARTLNERAELMGEGPAVFCNTEYDYLRTILPSSETPPTVSRPPCN
jgi:hypothetical protein